MSKVTLIIEDTEDGNIDIDATVEGDEGEPATTAQLTSHVILELLRRNVINALTNPFLCELTVQQQQEKEKEDVA